MNSNAYEFLKKPRHDLAGHLSDHRWMQRGLWLQSWTTQHHYPYLGHRGWSLYSLREIEVALAS